MKKVPGDIIILLPWAKNYHHIMHGSWDTVRDRRTDRQRDRKSDIERWVHHLKTAKKGLRKDLISITNLTLVILSMDVPLIRRTSVSVYSENLRTVLTLWCIMSQNGQTHFKNLAANAARFLKCAWPFWDIMHQRVK